MEQHNIDIDGDEFCQVINFPILQRITFQEIIDDWKCISEQLLNFTNNEKIEIQIRGDLPWHVERKILHLLQDNQFHFLILGRHFKKVTGDKVAAVICQRA